MGVEEKLISNIFSQQPVMKSETRGPILKVCPPLT